MIAHIVTMQVYPEHLDEFMEVMREHAKTSEETEPACLLYHVLQDQSDPCRIHVYEVFPDDAGFEAHHYAPHNLEWRERIKDWRQEERIDRRCATVYPMHSEWVK